MIESMIFHFPVWVGYVGRSPVGNHQSLQDASVCIVGHGGFTIENVRTCVERKAKKAMGFDRGS